MDMNLMDKMKEFMEEIRAIDEIQWSFTKGHLSEDELFSPEPFNNNTLFDAPEKRVTGFRDMFVNALSAAAARMQRHLNFLYDAKKNFGDSKRAEVQITARYNDFTGEYGIFVRGYGGGHSKPLERYNVQSVIADNLIEAIIADMNEFGAMNNIKNLYASIGEYYDDDETKEVLSHMLASSPIMEITMYDAANKVLNSIIEDVQEYGKSRGVEFEFEKKIPMTNVFDYSEFDLGVSLKGSESDKTVWLGSNTEPSDGLHEIQKMIDDAKRQSKKAEHEM